MTARILVAVIAIVVGVSNWLTAVAHPADATVVVPQPRPIEPLVLTSPQADQQRLDLLGRARLHLAAPVEAKPELPDDPLAERFRSCRFLHDKPSGTTPKFSCVLDDGTVIKVKYGRDPEIHAEVAATRLLRMLGYGADTVVMVPHLRCDGCPRYPFTGSYVLSNAFMRRLLSRPAEPAGYTDFEWVSVELRYPAPAIETESTKGWHWWELDQLARNADHERRADIDALRLLAAFLAHWDNKSENQRLVCLDTDRDADCQRPLAMIQDLGATFGPMKVNLARWRDLPVWHDRERCEVSMRSLPYEGASYPDAVISEAGRAQLAARLVRIDDQDVRRLFEYARFPEYQSATDDGKDLEAWTAAFRRRSDQIIHAHCPA